LTPSRHPAEIPHPRDMNRPKDSKMKPRLASFTALLALAVLLLPGTSASGADKLKVLIIDGQNNHDWKSTTPVLTEALESSGQFEVAVSTSPPNGASQEDWKKWQPGFAGADAVLSNYNGQDWPADVQNAFIAYVKGGGGLVIVHAADNSFGKWEEYNKMIGVGGWGGRQIGADGPWVHIVDGKAVRDSETTGGGGSHGPRDPFQVVHIDAEHPITKGLPEKWLHQKDELYCRLCGPAENMEVQGYAHSPMTKRNEPMLMTIAYGDGRVFHTPMGHDVEAMRCRGFFTIIQRGAEWAATGKVERTAEVPGDFPTADKVSVVPAP
jgi:type 1 glutamine amidotransferase